ncbi:MAG: type II toxin-antitoxin system HicB family antitoxin, partial [Candidatus Competibacter denitrificans]
MRYAVIIEKAENNYAAYVPDLPGCVAAGQTLKEAETQIQEAIQFHLRGMLKAPDYPHLFIFYNQSVM